MDKIICNVCGTSYTDSSNQCPICGYVNASAGKAADPNSSGYAPVRGGRFSNNNVKRRGTVSDENRRKKHPVRNGKIKGSNFVMGISGIALLVIVVLVIVLLASNALNSRQEPAENTDHTQQQLAPEEDDVLRFCQELHTDTPVIELANEGATAAVRVTTQPGDTTDEVTYVSMNAEIATVTADGTVTAVSGGETAVVVRCGNETLIITVRCSFAPSIPEGSSWSMNRKDITLSKKGETWDLYSKSSTIPKNLITWTSDDESVAKIDGGVVEAVGLGKTKVHGECNGITYSCTIRCNLPKSDDETEETKPAETEPEGTTQTPEQQEKTVKISHEDVTLRPEGEPNEKSFQLTLRDADGNKLEVTWKASEEGYVTIEGNKITAIKAGKSIIVSTDYEGVTYKCTIRLK